MSDHVLGTDYTSILQAKKQSRLFADLPDTEDLGIRMFFSQVFAWLVTRMLSIVSFFLNILLGIEKSFINLRVDTLQLFYWGRSTTFALFAQAIFFFVVLAIGFTWLVGQGLTPTIVQKYAPVDAQVYAASPQADVFTESGSLVTSLPKDIKRVDTETYVVSYGDTAGGDTLKNIADDWQVSTDSIRWANNFAKNFQPKVGATIKIPPFTGSLYTVQKGETLEILAARFKIDQATLAEVNFLPDPYTLTPGQQLMLPDLGPQATEARQTSKRARSIVFTGGDGGSFTPPVGPKFLSWPVNKAGWSRCWQGYNGAGHDGIDVTPQGTGSSNPTVMAAAPGRVVYAGIHCTPGMPFRSVCGGYAWVVQIDHGNGYTTMYGHLKPNSLRVRVGDAVQRGQAIASMGNTGTVFGGNGTHTHFQLNYGSAVLGKGTLKAVNPAPYLFDDHACP